MRVRMSPAATALACAAGLALLVLPALLWDGSGDPPLSPGLAPEAEGPSTGGATSLAGEVASVSGVQLLESELDVGEAAARVLGERRDAGGCVVARSGYLDLSGRTWGCVLQGSDWVEVVVVRGDAGGDGCEVVTMRMDAEDVASSVAGG